MCTILLCKDTRMYVDDTTALVMSFIIILPSIRPLWPVRAAIKQSFHLFRVFLNISSQFILCSILGRWLSNNKW